MIRRVFLQRLLTLPLAVAGMRHAAARAQIDMTKFAFVPAEITVTAGDRVTFVNNDLVPHTATARDGSFESGILRRGESVALVMSSPGEIAFFCRFHPHMTGLIHVR